MWAFRGHPTRQGLQSLNSGENGECGYSKNVPLLVVERESLGCVVVSSTLQNKYHSLLHPLSILQKSVELSHPLLTPLPPFLSSGFISSLSPAVILREGLKMTVEKEKR